jgi:transcriptional regulator with XRE-family HTH domain
LNLSTVRKGNRIASIFGKVLRDQRQISGLSQEALALTAEVDRTFVSQMERGIRQPTLTTLWKLAEALSIRPSVFVQKMERSPR